jgi:hypothetical protein
MTRYAYLCPICEREMLKTGFCHLECPLGHYQEVCSDLFPSERTAESMPDDSAAAVPRKQQGSTSNNHES